PAAGPPMPGPGGGPVSRTGGRDRPRPRPLSAPHRRRVRARESGPMAGLKSRYVVFTAPETVEVREEAVPDPGPGQVLCRAEKSLISIGTETHCLRGVFDPGTNWSEWVQYPFRPGYSMVGRVMKVGSGVSGFAEGDRLATSATHQDYFTVTAGGGSSTSQPYGVVHLPEGLAAEA